jgi:hypothetical protein
LRIELQWIGESIRGIDWVIHLANPLTNLISMTSDDNSMLIEWFLCEARGLSRLVERPSASAERVSHLMSEPFIDQSSFCRGNIYLS